MLSNIGWCNSMQNFDMKWTGFVRGCDNQAVIGLDDESPIIDSCTCAVPALDRRRSQTAPHLISDKRTAPLNEKKIFKTTAHKSCEENK